MFEKMRVVFKPIGDFLARRLAFIPPNVLSVFGFITVCLPAYFYIKQEVLFGGFALFVVIFDFLDGAVARYANKITKFGAVLDASLDRIFDGIVVFSIAMGGFVSWPLFMVVLIGFYMVSYVRARTGEAAEQRVTLNVGIAQRADRILILVIASVFYVKNIELPLLTRTVNSFEIAFAILAILTWITVWYRLYYAYKLLKKLD